LTNRIVRKISDSILIQIINLISPIILVPHLMSVLGNSSFSFAMLGLAWFQLCFVASDMGLSIYGVYYIAKKVDLNKNISRFLKSVFILKLFVSLALSVLIAVYFLIIPGYEIYISSVILLLFAIVMNAFSSIWYFQGTEQYRPLLKIITVTKAAHIITVISFVYDDSSLNVFFFSLAITSMLSSCLQIVYIIRRHSNVTTNWKYILNVFRNLYSAWKSRFFVLGYTSMNVPILGAIASPSVVGAYAVCEQLYRAVQTCYQPIFNAFYPFMIKTKNFSTYSKFLLYLGVLLTVGLFLLTTIILPVFENIIPNWTSEIAQLFNYFTVLICINFVGSCFGYPLFGALGKVDTVNQSVRVGLLFFIGALTLLSLLKLEPSLCVIFALMGAEFSVLIYRVVSFDRLRNEVHI
jgi:polysaccharide transporter, PST family